MNNVYHKSLADFLPLWYLNNFSILFLLPIGYIIIIMDDFLILNKGK